MSSSRPEEPPAIPATLLANLPAEEVVELQGHQDPTPQTKDGVGNIQKGKDTEVSPRLMAVLGGPYRRNSLIYAI